MMNSYRVNGSGRRWVKVLMVFTIILVLLLGGGVWWMRREYHANLQPASASQQRQLLTVKTGATAKEIAAALKEKGLIKSTWAFEWYVRNHNLRDKLQAGSYYLRPSMNVNEIVAILTQGRVATDLITILPAQRLEQIRQAFINNGFSVSEVDAALNPAQYQGHPALVDKPAGASLEGYLYPESFQKTSETKPENIISKSLDLMAKSLTPDIRAGFVKQGLTVHQGIIIASIVEQEVDKPSDKPTVAQVFLRRLKIGMPLGSDVTAFYGAIIAGQSPTVEYDSPYNTRIHPGLPAGPISNVSDTSLQAVAFPATSDYLYFVAGDDGTTYFSHTVQEHEALTQQHCTKLCR
jgi:UPF0755 protein